ncbi:MAG TPA: hypothetical protein DD730_13000 [Desulfosporosinus sp.]|nr:hypothetical protein [Desulfosporosinus sp.]
MSNVIFKMSFKHPNLKDTSSKNVGHVNYIATRSGVDKTLTESDLQKELEKGVEDLPSDDGIYLKYINERPRSHGLFSQNGLEDPGVVQKEIANIESFVWRGIVSLKEDDAKDLGYLSKDKWQDMLRKAMPDAATKMDIEVTNLRCVGAIHMEKGHPHAHVMLWEKRPTKLVGILNNKSLNEIRKIFTDEIFQDERFLLMNEKNTMRDLIKDLARDDVCDAVELLKEIRATGRELNDLFNGIDRAGIAPRLFNEQEKVIAEKLNILATQLPGKGRIALKFMPENIKEEVGAIADYLLQQPIMAASLEKNLKSAEELTRMYTGKNEAIQKARDNAYKDVRDRISQVILKGSVESQRDNSFYVNQELSLKAVDSIKAMENKINLIPEQTKVLNRICVALIRTGHQNQEIFNHLKTFMGKEHINYPDKLIQTIIDQAEDDTGDSQSLNTISSAKNSNLYLLTLKIAGYTEQDAILKINDAIRGGNLDRDKPQKGWLAIGKYINGEYEAIKTDYQSVRANSGIPDTISKTISNLSKTLLVSGLDLEETKEIIQQWNVRSHSNIDPEGIDKLINKAHSTVAENALWGKTTVISSKDWKAMFGSLGVKEKDLPKWIYKGENWKSLNHGVGLASIINDISKSAWRELEIERTKSAAQAEMIKKQLAKQLGTQSKEAMKEQSKINKDRSSMYRDNELEM